MNAIKSRLPHSKWHILRLNNMQQFGIIGYPLEHSFSAQYFNDKFAREGVAAVYNSYPIQHIEAFEELCQTHDFIGLNVTYPYKESIIPYLDTLDETAQEIGAVNVIHFKNGKKIGYNTDAIGFQKGLMPLLQLHHTRALILGTGGASKAIQYSLMKLHLPFTLVSRTADKGIPYASLTPAIIAAHSLIINCTPLGMYPDIATLPPLPYQYLTKEHLLYDVIYNPNQTLFLQQGEAQGARIQNGLSMLVGQAEAAWEIWQQA